MTRNQWDCLLQNLGEWQGSFARLSAHGEAVETTPTTVWLEGLHENKTVRQTIRRSPAGQPANPANPDTVLEYSTLGRGVLFFESGAFSQGSTQFSPYAEFGAEFGFIDGFDAPGNSRLRLVQLFKQQSQLDGITLIQEQRAGSVDPQRTSLQVADLLGTWHGKAVTLYPDWRSPTHTTTQLVVECTGDRLCQSLSFGMSSEAVFTSHAQVDGNCLRFTEGEQPIQVVLLPGGASSTSPIQIQNRRPFFIEAGWLLQPNLRQRMIRSYSDRGEWISLTLITEKRDF
jgi:Domain of unknown function (DUF3598)